MAAIDKLMTKTCSTKRAPAPDTDKHIGAPTTKLSGLHCMPLDPTAPEAMRAEVVNVSYRALFTLIAGVHDILAGDVLVVDSVDYPIRIVQRFDWRNEEYRLLAIEDVRPRQ